MQKMEKREVCFGPYEHIVAVKYDLGGFLHDKDCKTTPYTGQIRNIKFMTYTDPEFDHVNKEERLMSALKLNKEELI
jgi:hypothetical protein